MTLKTDARWTADLWLRARRLFLLKLFGIPTEDYKRFHNFLLAHGCKVDYRSFRQGTPEPSRRPQALLPPLTGPTGSPAAPAGVPRVPGPGEPTHDRRNG